MFSNKYPLQRDIFCIWSFALRCALWAFVWSFAPYVSWSFAPLCLGFALALVLGLGPKRWLLCFYLHFAPRVVALLSSLRSRVLKETPFYYRAEALKCHCAVIATLFPCLDIRCAHYLCLRSIFALLILSLRFATLIARIFAALILLW
jgi:hypothetical protein